MTEAWLKAAVGSRVEEFYAEIGVELHGSGEEASVRCFANSDAHAHGDKNKSCSVNLISGLWKCHGCGKAGNPYDAAVALNFQKKHAADLCRKYGLYLEKAQDKESRPPKPRLPTEAQIRKWRENLLASQPRVLRRLREVKGWTPEAIARCGLGWDGERVIFPVRTRVGNALKLVGVARYSPGGKPKMVALPGSKRDLFPAPELMTRAAPLFLVEGEPDAVSVRSCGFQAVGIPGTASWRPDWGRRFGNHRVIMLTDGDQPGWDLGRTVKQTIVGASVRVVPFEEGEDIGDWVAAAANEGGLAQLHRVLGRLAA